MAAKIWANSGDSHFLEPEDLWRDEPAAAAGRAHAAGGQGSRRRVGDRARRRHDVPPQAADLRGGRSSSRPPSRAPGARDVALRMTTSTTRASGARWCSRRSACGARPSAPPRRCARRSGSATTGRSKRSSVRPRDWSPPQVSTLDVDDAVASSSGSPRWASAPSSCRCSRTRCTTTTTATTGSRSGRPPRRRAWCIAFHIGTDPVDLTTPRAARSASPTAARAARS